MEKIELMERLFAEDAICCDHRITNHYFTLQILFFILFFFRFNFGCCVCTNTNAFYSTIPHSTSLCTMPVPKQTNMVTIHHIHYTHYTYFINVTDCWIVHTIVWWCWNSKSRFYIFGLQSDAHSTISLYLCRTWFNVWSRFVVFCHSLLLISHMNSLLEWTGWYMFSFFFGIHITKHQYISIWPSRV